MSDISIHTRRQISKFGIAIGILFLLLFIYGVAMRAYSSKQLANATAEQSVITVAVINPGKADNKNQLSLPGRFEAYATAPLYARVSGYLKSWKQDIGANVKAGQLLGEIEAPDLDQQLLQASADSESAKANLQLAEVTFTRTQSLLDSKLISKQDYDSRASDVAVKRAQYQSALANLQRLQVNKNFTRIIAPFDGVVIERNTDVGALISVGGSTPLFTVADNRQLRLYVNLPQRYASSIKVGDQANISLPERPGKIYQAKLVGSSGAVDAATGTTRLQLLIDNKNHELLPGSYGQVSFDLKTTISTLNIPASALIFNASGLSVATVNGNKAQLKTISIVRDLGKIIEVDGLEESDQVIDNPPDGINNGDAVRVKVADSGKHS